MLYDDEDILWKMAISKVEPLKSKKPISSNSQKKKPIIINPITPEIIPPKVRGGGVFLEAGDMSRVDGSVAKKIKDGNYPVDATLDLHGRTQDEAFEALRYFIAAAYSMGKRCILVITGKGADGQGVIKSNFPKWISNAGISEYILAYASAKQQHGGTGAFYVLLRKNK